MRTRAIVSQVMDKHSGGQKRARQRIHIGNRRRGTTLGDRGTAVVGEANFVPRTSRTSTSFMPGQRNPLSPAPGAAGQAQQSAGGAS